MIHYTKLPMPKDTAWERMHMNFFPWQINSFFKGVKNIFAWMPTVYKDRNYDDYYITKILQKKILFQRKTLVNNNRHEGVEAINFWMTVLLNLLERQHTGYYENELNKYCNKEYFFLNESIHSTTKWDNYQAYFEKYPRSVKAVKAKFPKFTNDNESVAMAVSCYNQQKCRNLLFEIMKQKSADWWD